jgi:Cu2+-exporting ATPase
MTCDACRVTIENALTQAGLIFQQVDALNSEVVFEFEDGTEHYVQLRERLKTILEPIGFDVPDELNHSPLSTRYHRWMGIVGVAVGIIVALASIIFAPLPFWSLALIALGSVTLTVILGVDSYQQAFKKLRKGRLTMDLLFAISTLTILLVSVAALFFPALPMMFDAGLLIFGFRHLGLAISSALRQVHGMTQRFQDTVPAYASIQPGDELELSQGAKLPVDGVLLNSDHVLINDCIVTGSNNPRAVLPDERLYAGTLIVQGNPSLRLRALASPNNSHLARLDNKIQRAKLERSELETSANKILQYFIPGVMGLALIAGILVASFFSVPLAIQCVVSILVSACPCTLGLITPLAIEMGMRKAARHGVEFNSARKLEAADQINSVVFDLNGTLTEGKPQVLRYEALPNAGLTNQQFINLMAHLESSSLHPVGQAIYNAKDMELSSEQPVVTHHHAGIVAEYAGDSYVLGSDVMMTAEDIASLNCPVPVNEFESIVFCKKSNQLIGYIVLRDPLRPNAEQMIEQVIKLGKTPYLCTGADEQTALRYARTLKILPEHIRANCVSHADTDSVQSKKQVINQLQSQGYRVAAVGDGANDAEMIAASDFGIAIQSNGGDERTQQEAGAVIAENNLQTIIHTFEVAQQTVANIKQNLIFSLLYNVLAACVMGGLLLTLGMVLNPAIGALLMIVQSSLILLNVARFAKQPLPEPPAPASTVANYQTVDDSYREQMMPLLTAVLPMNEDTNVASGRDSMRFTDFNGDAGHLGIELFDEASNEFSDCFNQLK